MPLPDWLSKLAGSTRARSPGLTDPYYRFQSAEEVQQAAHCGVRIDVNRAGVDDWLRLPGLSIHQARTLTELTQGGVSFHCLEDVAAAINVPVQRLQAVAPVLLFCYYSPDSAVTIQPINVNTSTAEQLLRVPSIDLYLARLIVQNRRQGPYRNLPDLQRRLGLSPELTANLLHYLSF